MSGDFAIAAEGVTDQLVLEEILLAYFSEEDDEPLVNPVQPLRYATGSNAQWPQGGWTLLRRYFEQGNHLQALQLNKYLVVQIDTDIADDIPIARVKDGRALSADELIDAVIEWIRGLVGEDVWSGDGHRFLFAIGIDEIECWMLPLVFPPNQKAKRQKQAGCREAIDRERHRAGEEPLKRGDHKQPRVYRELSRNGFRKRADVVAVASFNPGFARFVAQLGAVSLSHSPSSAAPT